MNNFEKWLMYNDEQTRPITREVYDKYYSEGREHFLACLDLNNTDHPYGNDTYYKVYPWYDGCRAACSEYFEEKYKIARFQNEVKQLIKEYGLILKFCDEYGSPYAQTPEGFHVELCDE